MLRAIKYRIYPTKKQQILMDKYFGAVRWVYNYGLEKSIKCWEKENKCIGRFDLNNELPKIKKQKETRWLKEINSQVLQNANKCLDEAFNSFFRKRNGFPKFKSKRKSKQNFTVPQFIKIEKGKLKFPKFDYIKIKVHKHIKGDIKSATISKTLTNKYFVSILIEDNKDLPKKKKMDEQTCIGIDLGIKYFLTLSNGTKIDNPRYLINSEKRLKRQQRLFSKKVKGSNNRNKQRLKVAKICEKVANQRKDFLHKLSFQLTHENQVNTIVVEDLDVRGLMEKKQFSRHIADVSWSKFIQLLKYKCDWYGINYIKIGRFDPSSKMCSNCGMINHELKLSDRIWQCINCSSEHDRDINAAINIKKFGVNISSLIGQGLSKSTLVESSVRNSLKQEALSFS